MSTHATLPMERVPAVTASGLTKSYGDHHVLAGIDLAIPGGSIFALLGPNGAGKTTAVQLLTTLLPLDGGEAAVAGHDLRTSPDAVRANIGVTGQFSAVDGLMTGRENLRLMTRLHHLGRHTARAKVEELLVRFDLIDAADRPAASYSGGMQRRLDLAMTLVGEPRVIFLDEPTTGLDPRSRRDVWAAIRELVAAGATVFLTTQYLEEADQLADDIAVLDGGRIIAQGTADALKRRVPGGHVELQLADEGLLGQASSVLAQGEPNVERLTLEVPHDGSASGLRDLLDHLARADVPVVSLATRTPDLDDVFLSLTDRTAAQAAQTEGTGR